MKYKAINRVELILAYFAVVVVVGGGGCWLACEVPLKMKPPRTGVGH